MSVAETGRIFQAIAERAIHADVSNPDHADRDQYRLGKGVAQQTDDRRRDVGMNGIVNGRPDLGAYAIGGEREIRCEEENDEQPPGLVQRMVRQQRGDERCEPFETQQQPVESLQLSLIQRKCTVLSATQAGRWRRHRQAAYRPRPPVPDT